MDHSRGAARARAWLTIPSWPHAASLRSPSQSVRNPTTEFQLGVMRDAGPEITNGLGAFLYAARSRPGFGGAFSLRHVRSLLSFATRDRFVVD